MSEPVIERGDKLHIITRRMFPDDVRRHLVGEVTASAGVVVEIQGYSFVFSSGRNEYRRRPELRTRICSLGDAGLIVSKLPRNVDLGSLEYRIVDERLVVTDMAGFSLDINEFGPSN